MLIRCGRPHLTAVRAVAPHGAARTTGCIGRYVDRRRAPRPPVSSRAHAWAVADSSSVSHPHENDHHTATGRAAHDGAGRSHVDAQLRSLGSGRTVSTQFPHSRHLGPEVLGQRPGEGVPSGPRVASLSTFVRRASGGPAHEHARRDPGTCAVRRQLTARGRTPTPAATGRCHQVQPGGRSAKSPA